MYNIPTYILYMCSIGDASRLLDAEDSNMYHVIKLSFIFVMNKPYADIRHEITQLIRITSECLWPVDAVLIPFQEKY